VTRVLTTRSNGCCIGRRGVRGGGPLTAPQLARVRGGRGSAPPSRLAVACLLARRSPADRASIGLTLSQHRGYKALGRWALDELGALHRCAGWRMTFSWRNRIHEGGSRGSTRWQRLAARRAGPGGERDLVRPALPPATLRRGPTHRCCPPAPGSPALCTGAPARTSARMGSPAPLAPARAVHVDGSRTSGIQYACRLSVTVDYEERRGPHGLSTADTTRCVPSGVGLGPRGLLTRAAAVERRVQGVE
jgi:hypothetical protein